tara:strand:+ start:3680 stop:6796 length:3117 start_codon:yes stop_codon:yes gene_type:complete
MKEEDREFLESLGQTVSDEPLIPEVPLPKPIKRDIPPTFDFSAVSRASIVPAPTGQEIKILQQDEETFAKIQQQAINKEKADKETFDKISRLAQNVGESFDPNSTESADLLGAMGQIRLGFNLDEEQYRKAITETLGEDNVKFIYDKDAIGLAPRHYISVKRKDGTFTPFSAPTQGFFDWAQRTAPALMYDLAGDVAATAAAYTATSAVLGGVAAIPVVGVPAAALLAAPVALYFAYSANKGVEVAKNYLREDLGLTDEETELFERFAQGGITSITPLAGTTEEEISGAAGALPAGFGLILDKLAVAMSKASDVAGPIVKKLRESIYPSAVKAQKFAREEGLPELILPQISSSPAVNRVAQLASQTNQKLPNKYRTQAEQIFDYLEKFGENVGKGDIKQFQKLIVGVADQIEFLKKAPPSFKSKFQPEELGVLIKESEELFTTLRTLASKDMYKEIFELTKGAAYDLDDIRAIVPKDYRTIIPQSEKADVSPISFGLSPTDKFDTQFGRLLDDIMLLGKQSASGTRTLNPQQVSAALKKFKEEHPEFKTLLENKDIDSTAKIMQMYASRLGRMASEVYSTKGGQFPNAEKAKLAMELRNALLKKIGEPTNLKLDVDVGKRLTDANDFYKETFDTLDSRLQLQTRQGLAAGAPIAELPETIVNRKEPLFEPLGNMKKQQDYISANIDKLKDRDDPLVADNIKMAIAQVLSKKLADATGTKVSRESANDPVKYFESFTDAELKSVGFTDAEINDVTRSLSQVRMLEDSKIVPVTGATILTDNIELGSVFQRLFNKDDLDMQVAMETMLDIIKKLPKEQQALEKENVRKGIINFVVSTSSKVIKPVTKDSPYANVGTDRIDVTRMADVLNILKRSNASKNFLKEGFFDNNGDYIMGDMEKLDNIFTYAAVVQAQQADAGSALAGAQIFGNMFTLDPVKFVSGLTRLGAQARIASLLDNASFTNLLSAEGKRMTRGDRIKRILAGRQLLGNVIATIALETARATDEDKQMSELMYMPEVVDVAPTFSEEDREFIESLQPIGN